MQPEDIDKLFRAQLRDHAPAPPAYLWDQLEAELKPAKKRPVMWLYASAAVIALLLLAGGTWLWQTPGQPDGMLASRQPAAQKGAADAAKVSKKSALAQATPPSATPSNHPEANRAETMVAAIPPQAPTASLPPVAQRAEVAVRAAGEVRRQPVAHPAAAPRPASAPAAQAFATTTAHPERPKAVEQAPAVGSKAETASLVASTASPAGTIEVEVRRGADPVVALADAPETAAREPKLVGRLLRKAGSAALREARETLPRVELPVVTLNVLNHSVSTKDIQL